MNHHRLPGVIAFKGCALQFGSSLERTFYQRFRFARSVKDIRPQPFTLAYVEAKARECYYMPDAHATFIDRHCNRDPGLRLKRSCIRHIAIAGSEVQRHWTSLLVNRVDVLLVNSPLFDVDRPTSDYADPPPLGLGYIGTQLRLAGHKAAILDAVAEGLSVDTLLGRINGSAPDVVGINVFSTNLSLVRRIVQGVSNGCRILVGGPAAGPLSADVIGWRPARPPTIVVGEAEHAVPVLIEQRNTAPLVHVSPSSEWFPSSIDSPLDRSLFVVEPVFERQWNHWEAHIITSRGCGHDCAFCGAARSANPGQRIRFRSLDDIATELDAIRAADRRVAAVRVLDDLFLRNPTFIERAAELFPSRRLLWRAMAHVAGLARAPDHVYRLLANSGCLELFVGIESGSPTRRALIGKSADIGPTIYVVQRLLRAGIHVKAYFVLGFPGETYAEMHATVSLATQLAEFARPFAGRFRASAFKFRPYHGTRLYNELAMSAGAPAAIREDHDLSSTKRPHSYDFMSDNFSLVETGQLNQFIADIAELKS